MAEKRSNRQKQKERTREAILDGAEKTFISRGFDGASMKHIAAASGVTQSLIHHHYGNKEALWSAVRERYFQKVFEALRPGLSAAARGHNFPYEFADHYFNYLRSTPDFIRLSAWIIAERELPPEEATGKAGQIVKIIEREQKLGRLRDDLPAEIILSLLWALIEGWYLGRHQYAHRLGLNFDSSHWDNRYFDGLKKILSSSFNGHKRE